MKTSIKHFFPLVLTVLCSFIGIMILFHGFQNHAHGIYFDIGTAFSDIKQNNHSTLVTDEFIQSEKEDLPTLLYVGNSLTIGEEYALSNLFLLQNASGTISTLDKLNNTALYLIDIKGETQNSVLTILSTSDLEQLEELPSKAIYNPETQFLYFHQSGIYTLYVRLYFDSRPGVLYQCKIPVETR